MRVTVALALALLGCAAATPVDVLDCPGDTWTPLVPIAVADGWFSAEVCTTNRAVTRHRRL